MILLEYLSFDISKSNLLTNDHISLFCKFFEGRWNNSKQVKKHSSYFNYVICNHNKFNVKLKSESCLDNLSAFYIEQSYRYKEKHPYRKCIMMPMIIKDSNFDFILLSCKIPNNVNVNLYNMTLDNIKSMPHSHFGVNVHYNSWFQFNGEVLTSENNKMKNNKAIRFNSSFILDSHNYVVKDEGFYIDNNERLFGSPHGPFKFEKF